MTFEEWWKNLDLNQFNSVIRGTAEQAWQAAQSACTNNEFTPTHTHEKSGNKYQLLHIANAAYTKPGWFKYAVYRDREGNIWTRRLDAFENGFIPLTDEYDTSDSVPDDEPTLTVSLETLWHFRCNLCNKWWSIGDYESQLTITCPHCNTIHFVPGDTV